MTTEFVRELDKKLLNLTPKDSFTVRDSFNGVHVFGAIGSGKTSGTGRLLSGAYLRAGYGLSLIHISEPTRPY